jgi:DNA-binding CsgD family transcriptional regulator
MSDQNVVKLSEGQMECLRLVLAGFEAKEIARKLLISPHTVVERLRAARRILNAQTSREAARIFADMEGHASHNRNVYNPIGIESPPAMLTSTPLDQPKGLMGNEYKGLHVSEMQMSFHVGASRRMWKFPLPFPTAGERNNDLNFLQTISIILALATLVGFICIAAISIVAELSNLLAK